MKHYIIIVLLIAACSPGKIEQDKQDIKAVLKAQQLAWSENDIDGFMDGYWKSDSLKYYGSGGLKTGWQLTLDNYKRNYPTKAETGELNFVLDDISPISRDAYYVMGQYHLTREAGNANGVFKIIFKKLNGEWKIISDLSCAN